MSGESFEASYHNILILQIKKHRPERLIGPWSHGEFLKEPAASTSYLSSLPSALSLISCYTYDLYKLELFRIASN